MLHGISAKDQLSFYSIPWAAAWNVDVLAIARLFLNGEIIFRMKMLHFGIVKSKVGAASLSYGQTNRRRTAHLLLFIVHKEKK